MLAGFLTFVLLVTRLFARTDLARSLHLYCVEMPLQMAQRIERRHLILLAILLVAGQSLAMIGSAEIALAYAVDLSVYFDVLIATSTAAIVTRVKNGWAICKARVSRLAGTIRGARPRSSRTRAKIPARGTASNDDEHIAMPLLRAA